jgi:hypothetical protein
VVDDHGAATAFADEREIVAGRGVGIARVGEVRPYHSGPLEDEQFAGFVLWAVVE